MISDGPSTADLLSRSLAGEHPAFARLIERESVRLRLLIDRSAAGLSRADYDLDDLWQEIVGRAWRDLGTFESRGQGSFWSWLRRIAHNTLVDRSRYLGAKGRRDVVLSGSSTTAAGAWHQAVDPATTARTRVAREEEYRRLRRALESLPPEQSRLIELHLLEELSIREMGRQLGISRSTAGDRLLKALAALRRGIDPHER